MILRVYRLAMIDAMLPLHFAVITPAPCSGRRLGTAVFCGNAG